jgi:hypothetical protein
LFDGAAVPVENIALRKLNSKKSKHINDVCLLEGEEVAKGREFHLFARLEWYFVIQR